MARRRKAADTSDFDGNSRGEGLENIEKAAASRAAETKKKGIGHNSGSITDDELKRQTEHCISLYGDLMVAKGLYDKANGAWRAGIDIAKEAGAPKKELVDYIKGRAERAKNGDGPMVAYHRNYGRLARLMNDPIGTQWGLFEVRGDNEIDEATGKPASAAMDAELQGQAAFRNGEPCEPPFQPATEEFVLFEQGWKNAERATAMQMAPGAADATAH
jgi:hypothetical protein